MEENPTGGVVEGLEGRYHGFREPITWQVGSVEMRNRERRNREWNRKSWL